MKAMAIAVLRLLAALLVFAGIITGCVVVLVLMILLVRFPLLLIAVLLACWIFSRLQNSIGKPSQ
jgi:hypothetical protein